jgi:inorganic triphosphatase YgiF
MSQTSANPRPSKEVEVVLMITRNFDSILDKLADLRSVADYRLDPGPSKKIRDTFFDTVTGDLRRRQANFRIRDIDGSIFISVKTDAKRTLRGAVLKKEVEIPWSKKELETVLDELKLKQDHWVVPQGYSDIAPFRLLEAMGLQIIQDRETKRLTRNILPKESSSGTLAELAIDHVIYHMKGQRVELFEVEIEEKAKRTGSAVSKVRRVLIESYAPALQKWRHGKLVTGLALQRMLETGELQTLLDNSRLRPEAFNRIDQSIRSSREFVGWTLLRALKPSW